MLCSSCGLENAHQQKFCIGCGARLEAPPPRCAACGTTAGPTARFCGECGTPLATASTSGGAAPGDASAVPTSRQGQEAPPRVTSGAVAERRVCSVLFVDLVGFTGLSERRDAEQVRELLTEYFELARTIVLRYGGIVEKFIGDAVMAVWGAPTAHDDDAERAVRAALEIVDSIGAFGGEHDLPDLNARAGVVTGEVAVTLAALGQGMVAGDAVNTASRVQSAAPPGAVYVDAGTRRQSVAAVAYVEAGTHELKGKAQPVELHRAVRVVAGIRGIDRVDGLEASFLGRDRELRTLKEIFHASADSSRAALVSVNGVPGVGKTRLRWEFEKYVDGLVETVLWHDGRCLPYGDGVAYWALAQMVRHRLGVAEEEAGDVVGRKLEEGLQRWVPDEGDRQFLEPRLGALLGTVDPGLGKEELFAGWRLWFERLADHNPLVLVIDDLQWADAGLLDFCEHLLEWAAESPIFVLTLARPELLERRPGWGSGRRSATSLALDPLLDTTMNQLLDELVPELPETVRARIVASADGVPLYAVELVRSLVDRDVIRPVEGTYRLVGEVSDLAVPASLSSLIRTRIDSLPEAERSLVAGLAVLGGTFPRHAVAAVSSLPHHELDALLASLVRREILTVRSERTSPERGHYAFTQGLLRTVAYDTLSRHDRRTRHLEVAQHLRTTFPDDGAEVAEVIAEHYRDAYLAVPDAPDADDVRRDAVAAFGRAAARASLLGAPDVALRAYRVAADMTTDDQHARAESLQAAGEAAETAGHAEMAVELHGAAAEAYVAAGDLRRAASSRMMMLRAKGARGFYTQADVDEARAVLDGFEEAEDDLSARVHLSLAGALVFTGKIDEATPHIERGLDLSQALDLPALKVHAAILKGISLQARNRNDEALMYHEHAVALARANGLQEEELRARICASDQCMISDLPGATEHAQEGISVARRRGHRQGEMFIAGNLAFSQIFAGDWDGAQKTIETYLGRDAAETRAGTENLVIRVALLAALRGDIDRADEAVAAMREWELSADLQSRAIFGALATVIALSRGDLDRALETGRTSFLEGLQLGLRHEAMRVLWPAAMEAALQGGRLADADELLVTVADRPPGQLPPYLHAETAHYRARVRAAHGEADGVDEGFSAAAKELRALDYPYFLARVLADHGTWLRSQGSREQAAPLIAEATAILQRLRAQPALAWLQRDLGESLLQSPLDYDHAAPTTSGPRGAEG